MDTAHLSLAVSAIRTDGGTQARELNSASVIEEYADAMRDGASFPAVVVFFDGDDYWLADGFHRILAARAAGLVEFPADIRMGTRRDAVLYACGANAEHGTRRTPADKRRAVLTLLMDKEWGQWSNLEIARRCNVGYTLVAEIRNDLTPRCGESSGRQRKGADGRIINTANIGRRPPVAPPPVEDDDDFWPDEAEEDEKPAFAFTPPTATQAPSPPLVQPVLIVPDVDGFLSAMRAYLTPGQRRQIKEQL